MFLSDFELSDMVRSRSEVGRIKVFTCMLKVRTMSDTIRNSNFLLHVNVLRVSHSPPPPPFCILVSQGATASFSHITPNTSLGLAQATPSRVLPSPTVNTREALGESTASCLPEPIGS